MTPHAFVKQEVAKYAQTFLEYPPLQKGATFNLERLDDPPGGRPGMGPPVRFLLDGASPGCDRRGVQAVSLLSDAPF